VVVSALGCGAHAMNDGKQMRWPIQNDWTISEDVDCDALHAP